MSILAKKTKTLRKTQKKLLKTKRKLNIKMSAKDGPVFTSSLPEGWLALFSCGFDSLLLGEECRSNFGCFFLE